MFSSCGTECDSGCAQGQYSRVAQRARLFADDAYYAVNTLSDAATMSEHNDTMDAKDTTSQPTLGQLRMQSWH